MNADLTLGLGTYVLNYADKLESMRKVAGLAPSLSCNLSIKSQDYVDSATKVPGTRTVVRIDRNLPTETGGPIAPVSAYIVVSVPRGSLITTAHIYSVIDDIVRVVGNDISTADQLALSQAIFVNGER